MTQFRIIDTTANANLFIPTSTRWLRALLRLSALCKRQITLRLMTNAEVGARSLWLNLFSELLTCTYLFRPLC